MKYTGPIYRPPYEASTLLLQVTVGCAHNKCTFCTMYRDVRFSIEKLDGIEKDLREASEIYGDIKRIFLVNGDAFVLSASKLKPIAELILKYFPNVEVITMYASINNIKGKSDKELLELKRLGINDLWVGAESGHEETLRLLNKGFSLEDSYEQMERLNKAGIRFLFGFMFGAAGKGKGIANARDTAKLINTIKPNGILPTTLGAFGNSELAQMVEAGLFEPATENEVIEEQKMLIDLVEVDTKYMGIHALNSISFDAVLPRDKENILAMIDQRLKKMNSDYLQGVPERQSV